MRNINIEFLNSQIKNLQNSNKEKDKQIKILEEKNKSITEHLQNMAKFINEYIENKEKNNIIDNKEEIEEIKSVSIKQNIINNLLQKSKL